MIRPPSRRQVAWAFVALFVTEPARASLPVAAIDVSDAFGTSPGQVSDTEPTVVSRSGGGAFLAWLRVSSGAPPSLTAAAFDPAGILSTASYTSHGVTSSGGGHITSVSLTTDGTNPYGLALLTATSGSTIFVFSDAIAPTGTTLAWSGPDPTEGLVLTTLWAAPAAQASGGVVRFPLGIQTALSTNGVESFIYADTSLATASSTFQATGATDPGYFVRAVGPNQFLTDNPLTTTVELYGDGVREWTFATPGVAIPAIVDLGTGSDLAVLTGRHGAPLQLDCTAFTDPTASPALGPTPCATLGQPAESLAATTWSAGILAIATSPIGSSTTSGQIGGAANVLVGTASGTISFAAGDTAPLTVSGATHCDHPSVASLNATQAVAVASCSPIDGTTHVIAWILGQPPVDAGVPDAAVDASSDEGSDDTMPASDVPGPEASDTSGDTGSGPDAGAVGISFRGGACNCRTGLLPAHGTATLLWLALGGGVAMGSRRRRRG